jgi:hypothetical protein
MFCITNINKNIWKYLSNFVKKLIMLKKYYKFWLLLCFVWLLISFCLTIIDFEVIEFKMITGIAILVTLFLLKELNLKVN